MQVHCLHQQHRNFKLCLLGAHKPLCNLSLHWDGARHSERPHVKVAHEGVDGVDPRRRLVLLERKVANPGKAIACECNHKARPQAARGVAVQQQQCGATHDALNGSSFKAKHQWLCVCVCACNGVKCRQRKHTRRHTPKQRTCTATPRAAAATALTAMDGKKAVIRSTMVVPIT